jgi:sporulation protein YlmC with PRC-barrel domain
MMQFKENAEVLSATGEKVGRIDRVVIDPKSNELTHLVVKKGFLFTKDKVVSLDLVGATHEDRVILKEGPGDPDDFPDFEETHYLPLDEGKAPTQRDPSRISPLAWYYPLPHNAWWRTRMGTYPGYPKPPYLRRTELNIPDETVPLEEGAKVFSREGDHVGDVERVYAEEEEEEKEQRVTHVLISQGLISKTQKLIPTMWVKRVFEDEVHLSISKNFVEQLPEYALQD